MAAFGNEHWDASKAAVRVKYTKHFVVFWRFSDITKHTNKSNNK